MIKRLCEDPRSPRGPGDIGLGIVSEETKTDEIKKYFDCC